MDLEKFFDKVNHERLMSTLAKKIQDKCLLKLIRRYLQSGVMINGVVYDTEEGTPQGGVISPVLSNLFLHYAFDIWMVRINSKAPFERYADDAIIHYKTESEAIEILAKLK